MSPQPRFNRPLLVLPEAAMNEKGLPLIIVTPSSPIDALTDFEVHFMPPPPRRRRPLFASIFSRRRSGPIALPQSPTPGCEMHMEGSKRRSRALLLLAIPLFIILAHLLLFAMPRAREAWPWLPTLWAEPGLVRPQIGAIQGATITAVLMPATDAPPAPTAFA